jgi:hypothetical protein
MENHIVLLLNPMDPLIFDFLSAVHKISCPADTQDSIFQSKFSEFQSFTTIFFEMLEKNYFNNFFVRKLILVDFDNESCVRNYIQGRLNV